MKLMRDIKRFIQYAVLTELLCAVFITEAVFHCENNASIVHRGKSGESDENISASSYNNDRWNAYSIKDEKWPKKNLTYTISEYSTKYSKEAQDEVMRNAVKKWADVSALTFRAVPNTKEADIQFAFVKNWGAQFRAMGFYPGSGTNTIRFSDDIHWAMDKRGGVNFLPQTATHELGHALGICHSNVPTSLMYGGHAPPWCTDSSLDEDDILAIQRLYGPNPRTGYKPKYDPGPSTDTPGNEPLWDEESGQAIMYIPMGSRWVLHLFKDDKWVPQPPNAPQPRKFPEPPPMTMVGMRGYARPRDSSSEETSSEKTSSEQTSSEETSSEETSSDSKETTSEESSSD